MDTVQVGEALLGQVDVLTPQIVDQIWEGIPGYSAPWLSRDDLVTGVTNVTTGVLRAFVGLQGDVAPELERARELGATRALQGVALESVVHSFRTVERALAEAVVSASDGMPVAELSEALKRLADGFDELSSAAIASYQDIHQSISAHLGSASSGFVTALMSGSMDAGELADKAALLDLDSEGTFQAFALHVGGDAPAERRIQLQRRAFHQLPAGRGRRSLTRAVRDSDVFIVPAALDSRTVDGLARSLFQNAGYPVWLSLGAPCAGLRHAGRSAHQAVEAMRIATLTRPPQTVTAFDDVLLDVMLLHSETATSRMVTLWFEPLAGHPHLLETIQVFLAEDMSIKACAERLFVHTNTVAYRLRRIQELTGVDPRDPLTLVRMTLALRARELRDAAAERRPESF